MYTTDLLIKTTGPMVSAKCTSRTAHCLLGIFCMARLKARELTFSRMDLSIMETLLITLQIRIMDTTNQISLNTEVSLRTTPSKGRVRRGATIIRLTDSIRMDISTREC